MAVQFYETMLGKMVIEQERMIDGQLVPQQYEIEIRQGKATVLQCSFTRRLNLRYKEAVTLAKYFAMDGVEVVGYYE